MGLIRRTTKRKAYKRKGKDGQEINVPEGITTVNARDDADVEARNDKRSELSEGLSRMADVSNEAPKFTNANFAGSKTSVDMRKSNMISGTNQPKIIVDPWDMENGKHYRPAPLKGWRRYVRFVKLIPGYINIPVPEISLTGKHHGWREVKPHIRRMKGATDLEINDSIGKKNELAENLKRLGEENW